MSEGLAEAVMFEDADKFMKIAVGLGILAAVLGVSYHYANLRRQKFQII